jgi:adenylate cyclase
VTSIALAVALLAMLALAVGALGRERRANRRLRTQLQAAESDLQYLQETCSRFAPAAVVQRLVVDRTMSECELDAERKVVTALFADIVGYTALSEQLEPAVLARVLNGYFQRMSDAIHEHRGHVSTFLGDGILAYFGALDPNPWQCNDAVHAAVAMQGAIARYNAELARERLPLLAIGIGIHRGPGLAGIIGSRERMEYAFVGRTVNLAARVQALTRKFRVEILITDALREGLDSRFALTAMPADAVKGIAEPVVTFSVGEVHRAG